MHCLTKTKFGPNQPGCTVNPRGRREFCIPRELNVNGDGLPVAVVGAGPAGLEAAVTLAKRGFAVTLFDKGDKLGGNINLASMPIGKYKLGWMVGYYENMLRKLGVTVRLGTTCTPEMLEELKPYAVFIATGSVEAIPPLPGIGGEGVIPVRSYLCERPEIKDSKVIVLGAGQTGLETARMLAVAGNEVTVVDMLPDEIPPITDHRLDLNYAREAGVKILMAHKVVRIEDSAVVVTDMPPVRRSPSRATRSSWPSASSPTRVLYDEVKDRFQNVFNLGDSDKPGMAVYAVSAGLSGRRQPARQGLRRRRDLLLRHRLPQMSKEKRRPSRRRFFASGGAQMALYLLMIPSSTVSTSLSILSSVISYSVCLSTASMPREMT